MTNMEKKNLVQNYELLIQLLLFSISTFLLCTIQYIFD